MIAKEGLVKKVVMKKGVKQTDGLMVALAKVSMEYIVRNC